MSGGGAAKRLKDHVRWAAHFAGWVAVPSFVVAMLGIGGAVYCDDKARFSPTVPDPVHGYISGVDYKGTIRYVSKMDAQICGASAPLSFSGMGIFILVGMLHYSVVRRLPGK
jgi:hypothetical protein